VWDLLAEGGKTEAELVKATSGAGFNIPDLTQIGASPVSLAAMDAPDTCA
jgi:hypothetical protein